MKEIQNKQYNYDGSVLFRARKRLGISLEVASKKLTLSVSQIKSIEGNLSHGYATHYFRKLAIERYAKILNININKVISYPEIDLVVLDSTEPDPYKPWNNFFGQVRSQVRNITIIILSLILLMSYFFFPSQEPKNKDLIVQKIDIPNDDPDSSPMIVSIPEESNNTDNLTGENIVSIPSQPTTNTDQNFICTIQSSPVTSFTTKTPDRPSSYFHLESLADQSICTVDSDGNLKNYTLVTGDKLTHRGKPPFKIQLDPTASTLYFQGWIVYLKASNKFIQLDPALTPLTD
jgi:hypothetical protein